MSASVLTVEEAKKAKIDVISDEKGDHAVHEVVVALRAGRRSGTACATRPLSRARSASSSIRADTPTKRDCGSSTR